MFLARTMPFRLDLQLTCICLLRLASRSLCLVLKPDCDYDWRMIESLSVVAAMINAVNRCLNTWTHSGSVGNALDE